MKKQRRIFALFCVLALLFSSCLISVASENDARFDSYVNMGQNAIKNNYAIPHLFRQNGVYSNMERFPLVVKNGVEYVPLSVFILYPYVEVNYSKTDESFFLVNTKNNHYISFNVAEGIASTHDGDLLKLQVEIFNQTKYVPARTIAVVLGFVCETYDDPEKGVYAFRVSDGKTGKTLAQLVSGYVDDYFKVQEEPETPPQVTQQDPIVVPEVPEIQEDPIEAMAERNVAICYAGISYENMDRIMAVLKENKAAASFSVTKQDILSNPDFIKRLYFSGNGVLITANAEGQTPAEYAESFVSGLEEANKAMKLVMKKKVRMCTLPFDMPEEIKTDETFISAVNDAGYMIFNPNVTTGDGPEYSGSAYTVSARIKSKITNGFDKNKKANVSALVWCSDKTQYYTLDVAILVNKYRQFKFCAINEAFLQNS